eukprot:COSAG01_NODE_8290_length_2841_cov_2.408826_1_plen_354_part_00
MHVSRTYGTPGCGWPPRPLLKEQKHCSASWLPRPQDTQHPGSMPPKRRLSSPAPRHDDGGAAAPEPEQGGGGGGQTHYVTAPEGVKPGQTFWVQSLQGPHGQTFWVQTHTGSGEVEVVFPPSARPGEKISFHLNETPSLHHTGHGGTGPQDVTGNEVRALSDPTLIMRAKCRVYLPQDTQQPGSMPPKRPLPSLAPRHDDRGAAAPEPEQGGGGSGQTIYVTAPEGVKPGQTFRVQTGIGEVEVEFPPGVQPGEKVPFHLNETPSSHHTGHGGTGPQDVTGYEVRALSDPTLIMRAKCRVYLRSRRLHSCSTCSMSTEMASSTRTNMKLTCSKLDQVETGTVYMITAQASGIT